MIITRDELNKIKELNKLNDSSTLLKIIQSAEEFGVIDGRKERQEANTIALRKVLTDCGLEVEGMGFGDMLYELRKTIKDSEDETSKEPKVLDVDGVEIKPGDKVYRRDEIPSLDGTFAGVVESVFADNGPRNKPWVRYKTGGWIAYSPSTFISMEIGRSYRDWLNNYRYKKGHDTLNINVDRMSGEINLSYKEYNLAGTVEEIAQALKLANKLKELKISLDDDHISIPINKVEKDFKTFLEEEIEKNEQRV